MIIGDITPPLASDLHPDIAGITDLHGLPLRSSEDMDKVVDHIADHLDEMEREEGKLKGLEHPVVVPDLAKMSILIPLIVAGALVGGTVAATSAFLGYDHAGDQSALAATDGYRWYGAILIL
ncbi:MAG: hypothetical protein P8J50_01015 [Acidimicrobiales bacterium]|nr:hypothetical protein [Acidimicrobiales bacterium]